MPPFTQAGRVLSIQSHVAFGYVGGKAAVFPLQCLGYDVDVVNTVNFSNHVGYGRFGGAPIHADELRQIFKSMEMNELLTPSRLLTGYIPGAEALSTVFEQVKTLKECHPDILYLLDPVMGDAGQLYVAADVVPVYRSMLPLATIISPNWFEVEILTGIELKDHSSLRHAIKSLHNDFHVPNVVISSMPSQPWMLAALPPDIRPSDDDSFLICFSSSIDMDLSQLDISQVHVSCIPVIPGYFSGVGDLFSALLLGHYHQTLEHGVPSSQTPLSYAASMALTKTHGVLKLTYDHVQSLPEEERQDTDDEKDKAEPKRKSRRMRGRELKLIQGQDIIRGTGSCEVMWMETWERFWDS